MIQPNEVVTPKILDLTICRSSLIALWKKYLRILQLKFDWDKDENMSLFWDDCCIGSANT